MMKRRRAEAESESEKQQEQELRIVFTGREPFSIEFNASQKDRRTDSMEIEKIEKIEEIKEPVLPPVGITKTHTPSAAPQISALQCNFESTFASVDEYFNIMPIHSNTEQPYVPPSMRPHPSNDLRGNLSRVVDHYTPTVSPVNTINPGRLGLNGGGTTAILMPPAPSISTTEMRTVESLLN